LAVQASLVACTPHFTFGLLPAEPVVVRYVPTWKLSSFLVRSCISTAIHRTRVPTSRLASVICAEKNP
ncbi:hypothetical protein KCU85_g238, partial [Aureobasidium melanogenum]